MQNVSHKARPEVNEINLYPSDPAGDVELHIIQDKCNQLQQLDQFYLRLWKQLQNTWLQSDNPYFKENDLLMKNVIDNKLCLQTIVLIQNANNSSIEVSS